LTEAEREFLTVYDAVVARHGGPELLGPVEKAAAMQLTRLLVDPHADARSVSAALELERLLPRPVQVEQTRIVVKILGKGAEGEYSRTLDEAVASWQRELAKHPEDAPEEPADGDDVLCLEDPTRTPEGASEPPSAAVAPAEPTETYRLPDNVISWPGSSSR